MNVTKMAVNIRSSLWFIPLVWALAGLGVNVVTTLVDRATDHDLISLTLIGGPDAALAILGTVAASMVGLVGTVLAITMVVIQLAMAQFSPRIVQTFLEDRPSQNAIGLFVATFVQSMLTMREVLVSEDSPVVPGVSLAVTFVMVMVVIVVLVIYIHHIGRALRVSALIELVGSSTRELTDSLYPDRVAQPALAAEIPGDVVVRKSGVLTVVNRERIVGLAQQADVTVELLVPVGQFVPYRARVATIHGPQGHALSATAVLDNLVLGHERTLDQDVAFGVRMLVDMGLRALADSPLADPTTAVQAIDRIHDLLRQLVDRQLTEGEHRDDAGAVRLVEPVMGWDDYVILAFEELRLAGAESPQVSRRLRAALDDLHAIAGSDRRAPLERQLRLLEKRVRDLTTDEEDLAVALGADPLGIGVRAYPLEETGQ